jgi:hypothetical protein
MDKLVNKVSRQNSMWRPWSFNEGEFHQGKEIKIEAIIIYDNGKILYERGQGWLESEQGGDVYSIMLPLIKRAVKEDLNRKDCYYIKGKRDYKFDDAHKLYINAESAGITVTKGKIKKGWTSPTEQNYNREIIISGLKAEFDNCRNCSKVITSIHSHTKPTKDAAEIEFLKAKLKKVFNSVSDYDVENFLKEFPETRRPTCNVCKAVIDDNDVARDCCNKCLEE